MINIVIPMAGRGSRFVKAGYTTPKPLLDVKGKTMIERVVENLRPSREHRFIFVVQKDQLEKYGLSDMLKEAAGSNAVIVPIDYITEGAACTVLLAEEYIDNSDELMIANADQYIDYPIDDYIAAMGDADGLVMTMKACDDKWSFIRYDDDLHVTEIQEKVVISDEATTGIYNFAHGSDYVAYAQEMIRRDLRTQGEFYVAPVYNMFIEGGKPINFKNVGSLGDGMYGLGVPEDLDAFLASPIADRLPQ